uniref:Uncharacterized protein n=1 Tax=Branchiostoma floridae TaxID=7739 RepID=C3ZYF6_BRAFL|eukprot:XP_002586419.1 hypothetical protein BRAFLDRAFT_107698 [Branchiostoma floridae]
MAVDGGCSSSGSAIPLDLAVTRGTSWLLAKDEMEQLRSVMPLHVRDHTLATMKASASVSPSPKGAGNLLNRLRDRDWELELIPMNEVFPVDACHQHALIKSLSFVHTARRYYRLNGFVRSALFGNRREDR